MLADNLGIFRSVFSVRQGFESFAHDDEVLERLFGAPDNTTPEHNLVWAFLNRMYLDAVHVTTQTTPQERVNAVEWFVDRSEHPFGYAWSLGVLDIPEDVDAQMVTDVKAAIAEMRTSDDRWVKKAVLRFFRA